MLEGFRRLACGCLAPALCGDHDFSVKTHRGDSQSPPVAAITGTRSQPGEIAADLEPHNPGNGPFLAQAAAGIKTGDRGPPLKNVSAYKRGPGFYQAARPIGIEAF